MVAVDSFLSGLGLGFGLMLGIVVGLAIVVASR